MECASTSAVTVGLRRHVEEQGTRWRLETTQGELTADVVVAATGGLSEPAIPDIPGPAEFAGAAFHTARWNHAHDLRGRRVAIVGTGASVSRWRRGSSRRCSG